MRFLSILIFLTLSATTALCQDKIEETFFPLYCDSGLTASMRIGISENFQMGFTITFDGQSPAKKMSLFFVDGLVEKGTVTERKVTNIQCPGTLTEGSEVCEGELKIFKNPLGEEQEETSRYSKIKQIFNFEQQVINISLRRGKEGKDYCLGKFINDEESLARNSRSVRTLCNFIPAEETSEVTGKGHFNPEGYGTEGDAHFHMSFTGLPTDRTLRACALSGVGRYRQMLQFRSYDANTTDAEIYGDLDEAEQGEFDDKKIDYSYDLLRDLTIGDTAFDSNISFVPNLSQVNLGIGGQSASKATKKGNRKRRRKRRRDKREGASRRSLLMAAADVSATANVNEDVFKWLSFDPQSSTSLYISDTCKGDVSTKAYGRLVCGDAANIGETSRKCVALSGDSGEGTGCIEPRSGGFTFGSVRVKDLSDGEYTVCLDNEAIATKLVIETDETGSFGLLEFTDSEALKNEMSQLVLINSDLDEVSAIGISETGDCSTLILEGAL